jgi:hypothetical protein
MSAISLQCWNFGSTFDKVYLVDIENNRYVSHLQKEIKEINSNRFKYIDLPDLVLWKVSVHCRFSSRRNLTF